jgi:hypothetical protein
MMALDDMRTDPIMPALFENFIFRPFIYVLNYLVNFLKLAALYQRKSFTILEAF